MYGAMLSASSPPSQPQIAVSRFPASNTTSTSATQMVIGVYGNTNYQINVS